MKQKIGHGLWFLIPFVLTVFNIQVMVARLISSVLAQFIAYGKIGLLVIGTLITLRKVGEFSKTARLWIFFYIIYFSFATLASVLHHNSAQILFSIIPFIYVIAFYVYLSIPENREIFRKVALVSFGASTILCIYLFRINFDLDSGGIYMYKLDRAEGVFGDANNASLVSILAFIFIFKSYNPSKKILYLFKIILLFLMFYSLALTFSTTGYFVFIISFLLINHRFFKGLRLLISIGILPFLYVTLINLNSLTANFNLRQHQQDKVNNIVNILTLNTSKVDDSGRNDLVANLLTYVNESPFIGNGIDFAISQHGHNTIVGVWADAGIFTLAFFLFMLIAYFVNALRSPKDIRFFVLPQLFTMCIFMLSLQSVINQAYLMALFVYLGYLVDDNDEECILDV